MSCPCLCVLHISVGFGFNESLFCAIRAETTELWVWQPGNILIISTWQERKPSQHRGDKSFPKMQSLFSLLMLLDCRLCNRLFVFFFFFFLSRCQQLFVFLADVLLLGCFSGTRPTYAKSFSICWRDTGLQFIYWAKIPAVPPLADNRIVSLISNICPIFDILLVEIFLYRIYIVALLSVQPPSGENRLHLRPSRFKWILSVTSTDLCWVVVLLWDDSHHVLVHPGLLWPQM